MRSGGRRGMLFVLLFFVLAGSAAVAAPGTALGYAFVVTSGRLPLAARIPMLLVLAVGSSLAWRNAVADANIWRPAMVALSFAATLTSGIVFLVREAHRRRAPRFPGPVWPDRPAPTGPVPGAARRDRV
ncbi:hypothetical protein ABT084_34125 [Streptomyces sp. NPDC002138]|uniref:hypothetical protein n=1 Tax=Streptomyces sp. NPDC002138 TaxID=3154410 RepID=UPI00331D74BF